MFYLCTGKSDSRECGFHFRSLEFQIHFYQFAVFYDFPWLRSVLLASLPVYLENDFVSAAYKAVEQLQWDDQVCPAIGEIFATAKQRCLASEADLHDNQRGEIVPWVSRFAVSKEPRPFFRPGTRETVAFVRACRTVPKWKAECFPQSNNPAVIAFERELSRMPWYDDCYQQITKGDFEVRCVLGSPGVGMSVFGLYLLCRLVWEGPKSIVGHPGFIYVWKEGKDGPEGGLSVNFSQGVDITVMGYERYGPGGEFGNWFAITDGVIHGWRGFCVAILSPSSYRGRYGGALVLCCEGFAKSMGDGHSRHLRT
jgi:hypothetical protein